VRVEGLSGINLTAQRIGTPGGFRDPANAFGESYGISSAGAVLVRPDGFVAWRAEAAVARPQEALANVLGRILSAAPAATGGTPGGTGDSLREIGV